MIAPPTPETIDRVIGIIRLFTGPREIDARAALATDLALDDWDRAGIAIELSEQFHFDVTDKDIEDWDTVEDVARTVEHAIRSKAA